MNIFVSPVLYSTGSDVTNIMGASASVAMQEQEARRRSRSIDDTIAQDKAKEARTVKIVMLGKIEF